MNKKHLWLTACAFLAFSFLSVATVRAGDLKATSSHALLTSPAPVSALNAVTTRARINNQDQLEKISSPAELKNFKVMKRVGNTLYGIRLRNAQGNKQIQNSINHSKKITANVKAQLEKISSPAELKNFKVMKRVGNALYGIRLSNLLKNSNGKQIDSDLKDIDSKTNIKKLEKIAAPSLIRLYTKIKKIGNSLWGEKKTTGSVSDLNKIINNKPKAKFIPVTSQMFSCVSAAIQAKDQAIIAKTEAELVSLKAAILARGVCQEAAIKSIDNQQEALTTCVKVFQASQERNRKIAQETNREAWNTYKDSLKACRANISTSTPTVSTSDDSNLEEEFMIPDGGNTLSTELGD